MSKGLIVFGKEFYYETVSRIYTAYIDRAVPVDLDEMKLYARLSIDATEALAEELEAINEADKRTYYEKR